eukprot:14015562-Ditylum_brightwellii.AAC.1
MYDHSTYRIALEDRIVADTSHIFNNSPQTGNTRILSFGDLKFWVPEPKVSTVLSKRRAH